MPSAPHAPLDLNMIRKDIDATLDAFLDDVQHSALRPELAPLVEELRGFLRAGGKRIRPLLCVIGAHAADENGTATSEGVLRLAASLEILHAAVLIHDDIIDGSPTRRDRRTAHRGLAAHCQAGTPAAAAARFGSCAALLLGDLAAAWSERAVGTAHFTPQQLRDVVPLLDAVRSEVLSGQYLDLVATGHPSTDLDAALAITRCKTAHYTVERPLQIGAAFAEAGAEVLDACSAFGIPLGEAFQLRDDLLGVFGAPAETGKPALDDLREGKHTPLTALALQRAAPAQRETLHALLGKPDLDDSEATTVRDILTATGARETIEEMISDRRHQALAVLDEGPFHPAATTALRTLADAATRRAA
ncbi:polyprenyl synthetase family protein [Streptomyces sp. CA-250714]|uniref:polyprenyl synthetase family protein n=1 Tax=Streptomyces sp. CA-250714 TaxID=3240060 RepID=UPI003D8D409F